MIETLTIIIAIAFIITGIFIHPILIKKRRRHYKQLPFPILWNAVIENNLPIYYCLSKGDRQHLQGHIQVFLAEKQFIGCNGLLVTEEMKITIAAVACLLLLNERGEYFLRLRTIFIYPRTYFVNEIAKTGSYIVEEKRVARLGESWTNDQLVLSWEQVQYDTRNWQDGRNIVLHEFAHQLDQEDGEAEGVPILPRKLDYPIWMQVMTAAYQQLCHDVQRGKKTVMDSYGTTNPAEFFAVATETFFEKPHQLQKQHSALYKLLQSYYQLDPVQWV